MGFEFSARGDVGINVRTIAMDRQWVVALARRTALELAIGRYVDTLSLSVSGAFSCAG
jgi:hypothetical protein